jgi:hypothetical protein
MSLITANGVAIVAGRIMMPLVGVWTADLVLDQPSGSGFDGGTQVTISSTAFSLVGTVDAERTGDYLDTVHVRLLGGAGGMAKAASPRSYVQPGAFVRDVLNGLMSDSGETLSTRSDPSFTGTNLAAWSVFADGPVSQAIVVLLEFVAPMLHWRFLSDGSLWFGSETWPSGPGAMPIQILERNPAQNAYELGTESPWIMPGMALENIGNVSRVEHRITGNKVRSRVWLDSSVSPGLKDAVGSLVAQAMAVVDYHAFYACQLVTQSTDLTTVDISPLGARNQKLLGGLQRVPLRGIPGVKVQIAPGATVMLGWDGGSPTAPFACLGLPGDTALKVQINGTVEADMSGAVVTVSATGTATFKGSGSTVLGNVGTFPVLTSPNAIDSMGVPVSLITPTTVLAG